MSPYYFTLFLSQGAHALKQKKFHEVFYGSGHVHHASRNDTGCPICNIEYQDKITKKEQAYLDKHHRWWHSQQKSYQQDLNDLRSAIFLITCLSYGCVLFYSLLCFLASKHHQRLLVVIDFSRFDIVGGKFQGFFLHAYRWNEEAGAIESTPYVVFPTEPVTNDAKLFDAAFQQVLDELSEKFNFKELFIWSDGGRKHFKQRYAMKYILKLQRAKGWRIVWNFFASHHGHGVCDADAQHVKQAVRRLQRHKHKIFKTGKQLAQAAQEVGDMLGRLVHAPTGKKIDAKKLQDITLCHKFTFDTATSRVSGFELSADTQHFKCWQF